MTPFTEAPATEMARVEDAEDVEVGFLLPQSGSTAARQHRIPRLGAMVAVATTILGALAVFHAVKEKHLVEASVQAFQTLDDSDRVLSKLGSSLDTAADSTLQGSSSDDWKSKVSAKTMATVGSLIKGITNKKDENEETDASTKAVDAIGDAVKSLGLMSANVMGAKKPGLELHRAGAMLEDVGFDVETSKAENDGDASVDEVTSKAMDRTSNLMTDMISHEVKMERYPHGYSGKMDAAKKGFGLVGSILGSFDQSK